jgi:glycosyltransferase involved in cell wall biosynthesis
VCIAHGEGDWTRELLHGSRNTVDHTIAVSRRVLNAVCDGFPSTVILNGIDTARLATTMSRDELRSQLGFQPDDFVVGYIGRLSGEKRPELLIRALQLLPQKFKGLFVGWGYMQPQLLEEANECIPNRYAFRFRDRYLGDFYQAFDAFSLCSMTEGFALVLLEAMFQGLPIVATPVGAVPEVIEPHVNGLIVDGEPESIALALSQLERNREWARGMGANARRQVSTFGHARRMADEYVALFERLANAGLN